ncbi:hypothetical protein PAPYR_2065 [Paratrimastix pyriformis]|uniref:Uncharacterized protein n=1 Tax=Paratrimastix pyriformis TaxID=342808 RepID=A0ABQ8UQR2_9EUKA|nr:hypothetical protein PAPYR_2065 [Paratrimastix pyriformis]
MGYPGSIGYGSGLGSHKEEEAALQRDLEQEGARLVAEVQATADQLKAEVSLPPHRIRCLSLVARPHIAHFRQLTEKYLGGMTDPPRELVALQQAFVEQDLALQMQTRTAAVTQAHAARSQQLIAAMRASVFGRGE